MNFIPHDFVQLGFIIHRMVFIINNSFVFFVCEAAYVKSKFQNVGQNAVYLVTGLILNYVRFHVTNGGSNIQEAKRFSGQREKVTEGSKLSESYSGSEAELFIFFSRTSTKKLREIGSSSKC